MEKLLNGLEFHDMYSIYNKYLNLIKYFKMWNIKKYGDLSHTVINLFFYKHTV